MNICVFCSASGTLPPEYYEAARQLGRWIALNRHTLVFGGCRLGLMEAVASAARAAGGRTIGVVSRIVEEGGRESDNVDTRILCESLDDRKAIMVQRSDVFVALPGGIGTLDEVFTVLASASIGYHAKRVVLYNVDGFWDSLLAMLGDLRGRGVIRRGFDDTMCVADSMEQLEQCLSCV